MEVSLFVAGSLITQAILFGIVFAAWMDIVNNDLD